MVQAAERCRRRCRRRRRSCLALAPAILAPPCVLCYPASKCCSSGSCTVHTFAICCSPLLHRPCPALPPSHAPMQALPTTAWTAGPSTRAPAGWATSTRTRAPAGTWPPSPTPPPSLPAHAGGCGWGGLVQCGVCSSTLRQLLPNVSSAVLCRSNHPHPPSCLPLTHPPSPSPHPYAAGGATRCGATRAPWSPTATATRSTAPGCASTRAPPSSSAPWTTVSGGRVCSCGCAGCVFPIGCAGQHCCNLHRCPTNQHSPPPPCQRLTPSLQAPATTPATPTPTSAGEAGQCVCVCGQGWHLFEAHCGEGNPSQPIPDHALTQTRPCRPARPAGAAATTAAPRAPTSICPSGGCAGWLGADGERGWVLAGQGCACPPPCPTALLPHGTALLYPLTHSSTLPLHPASPQGV